MYAHGRGFGGAMRPRPAAKGWGGEHVNSVSVNVENGLLRWAKRRIYMFVGKFEHVAIYM
jgi:hypothetical protein